jgi:hypothetical protein
VCLGWWHYFDSLMANHSAPLPVTVHPAFFIRDTSAFSNFVRADVLLTAWRFISD